VDQSYTQTSTSSPGKLVISGEYAVLYGAPALAMAVNRRADCSLLSAAIGEWDFKSIPEFWNTVESIEHLLSETNYFEPARIVRWFAQYGSLPKHLKVITNTTPFFTSEQKLGIGSSAAVLVSFGLALAKLNNLKFCINELFQLYDTVNQTGSGIDVATSFHGGVIRFEERIVSEVSFPDGLCFKVFYVGASVETKPMVNQFRNWFDEQPSSVKQDYLGVSENVAVSMREPTSFLAQLTDFITVQKDLDERGRLGIWSSKHKDVERRAEDLGVVYKPSGAGGGDVGIGWACDPESLHLLADQVQDLNCSVVDLDIEKDGARVESVA